jgi:hypothetical protein
MTNGLANPGGHLVLPISPDAISLAAQDRETMHKLHAALKREGIRPGEKLNDIIVRQSHRFVWGSTDGQVNFVEKRIGQKERSTPSEAVHRVRNPQSKA